MLSMDKALINKLNDKEVWQKYLQNKSK